ncbi:MAG: hypothetical protein FWH11_12440 [Micrococcales bacterium]|nr:hypothetical protein [Micrococcales bacterium]
MSETLVPRGWRYADHIPYNTPASLDDLHGPTSGTVRVQEHIDTGLNPVYDIADASERWSLYVKVVQSATAAEQAAFLDRTALVELWPTLMLPQQCRAIWEAKFPELAATMRQIA